ncbi:MAG: HEAT repeat domain-containing protein [Planctomycetes bacterium]|nr:HEAT repeat domain-containing protein [Planctomycetota bacterium]
MTSRSSLLRVAATASTILLLLASPLHAVAPQDVPDFTHGGEIPAGADHDWTLGATGARGWMYSDRLVTTRARQILVTSVERDSPADSILAVGDVILGVDGTPFSHDPRTELGRALTAAESEAGRGQLALLRWRAGETAAVVVELPVLGSYASTAPYDCPKSRRILGRGCAALARRMEEPGYRPDAIPRSLNALALLASGDRTYLPLVRREAQWAAQFSADSFQTWYYGYVGILLAEYLIATGDESVLPGLRRIALEAANGQSRVGSWGHGFARPDGRLGGYGMMNSPGVPLTIALVMARAAGVHDPAIDRAIERSLALLRFYIGKGAIPYGDHDPWIETHEDNGKCGMGAVLFDLVGDREGASFFSRLSVASHGAERDTGHTGNFFNLLWALPGVSRSGRFATGAWMEEFGAWYFDLARQWDGTFRHQGAPEARRDTYFDWDATGAYLIAYAMPLRKIVLTGRPLPGRSARSTGAPELDAAGAASLIADGRGWDNADRTSFYSGLDDAELLRRLGSWSPVVRERAAMALTRTRGAIVPDLVEMLASPSLDARYGACAALARLRAAAAPAVPALEESLRHPDLWLRVKAAEALGRIGEPAMGAVPTLLETLTRAPGGADPRGMEQRYLCFTLFDRRDGMLRRSLDRVDREALYAAVRAGLCNEDGRARGAVGAIYDSLSFEDVRPLLPAILRATMESAPSGIMFADDVRVAGLRVMARHHVEEGIDACVFYVRHQKQHASEHRTPEVLELLRSYGAHAQRCIPELERIADYFENDEQDFPKHLSRQKAAAVRDTITAIRASEERPALVHIESRDR